MNVTIPKQTFNNTQPKSIREMADSEFQRAGHERINVFAVDDYYLFKHYFEGDEVFARLGRYYNNQQYRFEVPAPDFEDVQSFVAEHGYALVPVDEASLPEFVVAVRKYTAHPDNIFKASVIQRSSENYNCFLMTDQDAVEQAVKEGAVRLTQTSLGNRSEQRCKSGIQQGEPITDARTGRGRSTARPPLRWPRSPQKAASHP